jgi:beta-glucosidase
VCVPATVPWCSSTVWRNPFASVAARIADVLPQLTLQEKVNLLQTTPVNASEVPRLGIFRTATAECLHGYCSRSPSTVFPQSTTLSASFNPPLLREVAAAVGLEARAWRNAWVANGSNYSDPFPSLTCFAPQINIVRDSRWGRGQETYGEDPTLTSSMVGAYIDGLQNGDGRGGGYLLAAAMTKHFIGYQGASTRGQWSPTEVYVSWRDQIDTFEPGWRSAVRHGTAGVMCAYSSLCHDDTNATCGLPPPAGFGESDGVPMCANAGMINGWLRGGADGAVPSWDGVVVGDCGAVQFIQTDHRYVDSQEAAAAAALTAGVDLDCSISVGRAFAALVNATAMGLVNASLVDAAVGRLLAQHLRQGLYDPPEIVPWAAVPMAVVNSAAHRGLAARGAREGIVLLSNGRGLLPLSAGALGAPGAVLVTGPNAQMVASGNYKCVCKKLPRASIICAKFSHPNYPLHVTIQHRH